jgi:Transcriptional regulators
MKKEITISNIAEKLGVSKSTVSRAISGKGRIGKETRDKILNYIMDNEYQLNGTAYGTIRSKTYSIGIAIPAFSDAIHSPFFQRCILGSCEVAQAMEYDVIVSSIDNDNIRAIERLVENKKIDGIILTRPLIHDRAITYLKEHEVPFVVIGSLDDEDIYQVDSDNKSGCKELTSYMAMIGMKRIGLIGGNRNHKVTLDRYSGFEEGVHQAGKEVDCNLVFLDILSESAIRQTVKKLVRMGADCIACMDDYICIHAFKKLKKMDDKLLQEIKLISFYGTGDKEFQGLDIYSLQYDPHKVSAEAARVLFQLVRGEKTNKKTKLGYEVILRKTVEI